MSSSSAFWKVVKDEGFVDRTMFIKDYLEMGAVAPVFFYPPKSGKTHNLSMLKEFLSYGAKPGDFGDFSIGKESEICDKYCGKFPVVHISFKDCVGATWEEMRRNIWKTVSETIRYHIEKDLVEAKQRYLCVNERYYSTTPPSYFTFDLTNLTEDLQLKYRTDVFVLIDDYNTPVKAAWKRGYFDEARAYFESMLSSLLKDNSAMEMACVMGTYPERGEPGVLPNNTFPWLHTKFAHYFAAK